jgi:hypothetical protein
MRSSRAAAVQWICSFSDENRSPDGAKLNILEIRGVTA